MAIRNEEEELLKAWLDTLQSIPMIVDSQTYLTRGVYSHLSTLIQVTDDTASSIPPNITRYATLVKEEPPKPKGFTELLHEKDDREFFQYMRIKHQTYAFLLSKVKEKYKPVYVGGHQPVSTELALDIGLWYLGNKCTYKEISEHVGLSESSVFKSVGRIVDILCDMLPEVVKWPSQEEVPSLAQRFSDFANFPGVIGAIGGCRIRVKAPGEKQLGYKTKTSANNLNLLAICDNRKKFLFVSAGFPGTAEDSSVFEASAFYATMYRTPQFYFPSPEYHLVGDSSFPLSRHILVPYRDTGMLSRQQLEYNTKLYETRHVIKNAFVLLKARFRRLNYVDANSKRLSKFILACCVLHNIIIDFPEEELFLYNEGSLSAVNEEDHYLPPCVGISHDVAGFEKRDYIASSLYLLAH